MRMLSAKESYSAEESLFDSRTQWVWMGVLGISLLAFPFVASPYWLFMGCLVLINLASATGLNVLTGYTGQVSIGHGAFMALGAYTVGLMEKHLGLNFVFNVLAGGGVAMLAGLVVGIPSLRIKGLYLAITTIGFSYILNFVFSSWTPLTGGTAGLSGKPASFFGMALDNEFRFYWLVMPVTVLMICAAANLFRTRIGRAFIAIRDRDISAEVIGIPLLQYKLYSFGISSFYAGVAGALWMYFFRFVAPDSFPLVSSIFFLTAIIVGGMGTTLGCILGTVFMTLVPELLKPVAEYFGGVTSGSLLGSMRTMVFGAMIVGFLIFEPLGLVEVLRRIRRFFHLWPFRT